MISLSKITQSTTNAAIIIRDSVRTRIKNITGRISRSATLDGGAVIEHLGVSDGDRRFQVFAQVSESDAVTLWAIFKNETFINISTKDGFFYGVIESMAIDFGSLSMIILIKE